MNGADTIASLDMNVMPHITRRSRLAQAVCFLALVFCIGCGQSEVPLVAVEGTVRLGDQPLENVLVAFLPDPAKGTTGPRSAAVTDSQGHFRLKCDDQRDGAVVGWHRVVVEDMAVYALPRKENAPKPATPLAPRFPAIYGSSADTPLLVQVQPEKADCDLRLEESR